MLPKNVFKTIFKNKHINSTLILSISTSLAYSLNAGIISWIHKAFVKCYYNQKSPKNGLREVRTPYWTQINNTCVEFVCTLRSLTTVVFFHLFVYRAVNDVSVDGPGSQWCGTNDHQSGVVHCQHWVGRHESCCWHYNHCKWKMQKGISAVAFMITCQDTNRMTNCSWTSAKSF